MKVLAIGAHADDVELGCGGTLLRFRDEGHELTIYTVTNSAYSAPDGTPIRSAETARQEAENAAKQLRARLVVGDLDCFKLNGSDALNSSVAGVVQSIKPDLILTHWAGDPHADHRAVALATLHSARSASGILSYVPNWQSGEELFDGRFYVDISNTLEEKLKVIALYEGENKRTGDAWIDFSRTRAAFIGRTFGTKYAENFVMVRYGLRLP
jgi:LmbE family N-acetylglucosaminyl deacetylase